MTEIQSEQCNDPIALMYKEGMTIVITKAKIYLLGGLVDHVKATDTVYSASVGKDKKLGTWKAEQPMPATTYKAQAIVTKNRVYLLGGYINDEASSAVYTASINKQGSLGKWKQATPLPSKLSKAYAAIHKGRAFLVGKSSKDNNTPHVYTAPINKDGTVGPWSSYVPPSLNSKVS